jgi:hypothetical protein
MKRILLAGLLVAAALNAQEETRIAASMCLVAENSDQDLIRQLLDQQLIVASNVERIRITDIASDGFGEGDLLQLFPGGESHLLRQLSGDMQVLLAGWAFASNHEVLAPVDVTAAELRSLDLPAAELLGDVMQAARKHLGLAAFEMAVDYGPQGLQLRIWDYPGDSLYHRPGFDSAGGRLVDVVQILRSDTTYVVDKVLRDLIIIESRVEDTVYPPDPRP